MNPAHVVHVVCQHAWAIRSQNAQQGRDGDLWPVPLYEAVGSEGAESRSPTSGNPDDSRPRRNFI